MNNLGLIESVSSMLVRGGWVLLPIFLIGWFAWFFIVERIFYLNKQKFNYTKFWKEIDKLNADEAIKKYANYNGNSYFKSIVIAISTNANKGEKVMINWLNQVEAEFQNSINHHVRTITVLAAMAPLLGLLGTVSGMVHTFENITLFGFGNPVLMADGISEALLTTQAGLIVAFPLVLAGNNINNRVRNIQDQVHKNALYLVSKLNDKNLDNISLNDKQGDSL